MAVQSRGNFRVIIGPILQQEAHLDAEFGGSGSIIER
jgi:hypothetical protein